MESFLRGQGLNAGGLANDVKKVSGTASDAYTQAKPTVDSTIFTLSNSSPALLAEYALGALALYYLVSLTHSNRALHLHESSPRVVWLEIAR